MKLISNVEFSHAKEVVISRKLFYVKNGYNDYFRDDARTSPNAIKVMPELLDANEMADYIREYIGRKKWKVVLSSGTVNIFKKKKNVKKSNHYKNINDLVTHE